MVVQESERSRQGVAGSGEERGGADVDKGKVARAACCVEEDTGTGGGADASGFSVSDISDK